MEMTYEQRQDYNKLTKSQKEDFDYNERKHPNWTFTQLMAKVAFEEKVDDTIGDGGKNVDSKDPIVWITILEGVKTTLKKFRSIANSIFTAIDGTIASIKGMIAVGMRKVGDVIERLFDSLF